MIFQENRVVYISLLYILAKYESIWSDISAQTVTLDANLLFMAQTIRQNRHRVFVF